MTMSDFKGQAVDDPEPRWHALVAVCAVAGLSIALPPYLIVGPRWLYIGLVVALLIPTVISHRTGHHRINKFFGFVVVALLTGAMIISVILLIVALPAHRESGFDLLISAVSLWGANILVFALWYWKIDAGGPHGRDEVSGHSEGAFLFPQMTMKADYVKGWSPNFIDYLFLAFNTSTAFSPTDAPILARWAKLLMMVQASISLTVIALLAGRVVNIL